MTSALHAEGREFDSHWKYCPRGPTDKASDYESGDCGFESHRGCFYNKFIHSVFLNSILKNAMFTLDLNIKYVYRAKSKKVPPPGFEPGSHG